MTRHFTAILPENMDSDQPLTAEERQYPSELSVSELTGLQFDGVGAMHDGSDRESIQHDNTRRAGFALQALQGYADTVGGLVSETAEVQMGDLLADLMHLADALELDFGALVSGASDQYYKDLRGEN